MGGVRITCEVQSCSAIFKSRGHKRCSSHAPCLLTNRYRLDECEVCRRWLEAIFPQGEEPRLTNGAFTDLKEWWTTASKSRNHHHHQLEWEDRHLGFRLGLSVSSHSKKIPSSSTSCSFLPDSRRSPSVVLTVREDMSVSSLPPHPPCQDSQEGTLMEQDTGASKDQVAPPPETVPAPSPATPREWQDWMGSVNSFMARMDTLQSTRNRLSQVTLAQIRFSKTCLRILELG
ncbi:uncharacterized protein LOC123518217 [Portunus trituberculatus]|uniref:uncharacterized protein LOC123518217 n=1 Tax=Portunus trituberculatus TaxID=210409 RepID=UPI001E1CC058|nr:uncharacterized protein LOC123518217 [Portunus trituberculatus]XP_045134861.1 uncharacterized protein LOC123518217 [Portunus trituberculatus]